MTASLRATILNVDDSEANRYATSRMLRGAGFDVVEAASGGEALKLARDGPDLILLDIHLPDMLGFDVCSRLKADDATSSIPILHLTATVRQAEAKVRALELGADGYLTEPVEPDELVATVKALLRVRRAEQQVRELNRELERRVAERTALAETRAEELRRLAAALTLAERRERKRIAADLHDHLAQLLVVCRLKLPMIRAADAQETVREIDGFLVEAIDYTRTLISDLSPSVLHDGGIAEGLRWLAEQMAGRGLNVAIEDDGEPKPLSDELLVVVFESTRELLYNALKHSGVTEATVSIRKRGSRIEVRVRDDGAGYDTAESRPSRSPGGFGLLNVRERLALLGGRLDIASSPGRGTTAIITAPMVARD
jgi:signal transduction histidine kinase